MKKIILFFLTFFIIQFLYSQNIEKIPQRVFFENADKSEYSDEIIPLIYSFISANQIIVPVENVQKSYSRILIENSGDEILVQLFSNRRAIKKVLLKAVSYEEFMASPNLLDPLKELLPYLKMVYPKIDLNSSQSTVNLEKLIDNTTISEELEKNNSLRISFFTWGQFLVFDSELKSDFYDQQSIYPLIFEYTKFRNDNFGIGFSLLYDDNSSDRLGYNTIVIRWDDNHDHMVRWENESAATSQKTFWGGITFTVRNLSLLGLGGRFSYYGGAYLITGIEDFEYSYYNEKTGFTEKGLSLKVGESEWVFSQQIQVEPFIFWNISRKFQIQISTGVGVSLASLYYSAVSKSPYFNLGNVYINRVRLSLAYNW